MDDAGDVVDESDDPSGIDLVGSSVDFDLGDGVHALGDVENLILTGSADLAGSGNALANRITGNAGANLLHGGDGDDILSGGAGADLLYGDAGNDTYAVDDPGDRVFEAAGGGNDAVLASVSYALADGQEVETLRASSGAGLALTGNAFANRVVGGAGDDTLSGGGGRDLLTGGAGADAFRLGPPSADTVRITDFSGASGDTLRFSAADYGLITGAGLEADGTLSAGYFETGRTATRSHGEFLFDAGSRSLLWDADGAGSGAAIALTTLIPPPGTPAADILQAGDLRFA